MCIPNATDIQEGFFFPHQSWNARTFDLNQDSNQMITSSPFDNNQAARDEVYSGPDDQNNMKHCVQHNYHDHANDDDAIYLESPIVTKGGVAIPFPMKLHIMLDHIDQAEPELSNIIRWQPHGRCFLVKKPKEFAANVLPRFFDQRKYASFQRQLNLYGFNRITAGPDKGSYYHELFLRTKKILCRGIHRKKIKGTGTRMASNPQQEPNFYKMEAMPSSAPNATTKMCKINPGFVNFASQEKEGRIETNQDFSTPPPLAPVKIEENELNCDKEMPRLQSLMVVKSSSRHPSTTVTDDFEMRSNSSFFRDDGGIKVLDSSLPNNTLASTASSMRIEDQSDSSSDLSFVFGNMPFHSIDTSEPYLGRRNSFKGLLSSDLNPTATLTMDNDTSDYSNCDPYLSNVALGVQKPELSDQGTSDLLDKIVNQDTLGV